MSLLLLCYIIPLSTKKQWRKKKENKHDIDIVDKLLKEMQQLGYGLSAYLMVGGGFEINVNVDKFVEIWKEY